MRIELLPKSVVDSMEFEERGGNINVFSCPACRRSYTYLYAASGVTPGQVACICGQMAYSQFSLVSQPTLVWYRPENLKEIKEIVDRAYEADLELYADQDEREIKAQILQNFVEHYNLGGLFSRRIN